MNPLQAVNPSELLNRIANGDRQAFRQLYDGTGSRLFAICLRMMKSRPEAEDVLQDAFVKIWEKSWQYDPAKGDALAWLATVTRHTALDRLRSHKQGHVTIDDDVSAEIDLVMSVKPEATGEFGDLDRCLRGLRDDYRNAVVLAYTKGMTHEELAEQLGKPLGTIKSWVTRGLAQLRECMQA